MKGEHGPAALRLTPAGQDASPDVDAGRPRSDDAERKVGEVLYEIWKTARKKGRRLTDDPAEAEDVASEIVGALQLELDEKPWLLTDLARRNTYVRRAVINRFSDRWEAREVRERAAPLISVELELNREPPDPDGEEQGRFWLTLVGHVVDQLRPRTREVWNLRHVDGLMPTEIAARLGTAPATVHDHLNCAMRDVRRALERTEHDFEARTRR